MPKKPDTKRAHVDAGATRSKGTAVPPPATSVGGSPSPDVRSQADGSPAATDDANLGDSAKRVSTGMGAFGDGDFPGGASGARGYGQDPDLKGGLGQGSGYAQSSGLGGYGQGAPEQGQSGQSGAEQHNDERYSEFDEAGEPRGSQYGYGGRGTDTPDDAAQRPPDDARSREEIDDAHDGKRNGRSDP